MYKIYNNSINYSGNNTTLLRLKKILNLKFTNKIENNIIGIHAYKFGKLVYQTFHNYIIILGGTDVNVDINDINKLKIMKLALKNAKYIVAFNSFMKNIVINKMDIDNKKIKIIPQSIDELYIHNFDISLFTNKKLYIMIGNLRPVKDPTFLFNYFKNQTNKILLVIGNIIEGEYKYPENVYHINGMEQGQIYSIMSQADGIINTSISEGMSISLLEAMKLKCCIYARENEGNKSIINNFNTGFLFKDETEFHKVVELDNKQVIQNAYDYVTFQHNIYYESFNYNRILY